MTHYIHNINPVLLELPGPLAVRWYGISYLLGYVAAILLLRRWSRKGEFKVPRGEVANFVVMLALFGVFLGGRIGHILLYSFDSFLENPLYLVQVWKGGMSSHGGFIGVILFMLWYAKKHSHSFWNLTDNMACTASLGFAFGRLANFINGELWGRISNVRWAVIFPQELGLEYGDYQIAMIERMAADGELLPRHPSQLYQAFAEGFLVFGLMLLLRRTAWGKRPGALSAGYLILYALARIGMEFFRAPDNGAFLVGWLTKGQFYSVLMLLGAIAICWKMNLFSNPRTHRS